MYALCINIIPCLTKSLLFEGRCTGNLIKSILLAILLSQWLNSSCIILYQSECSSVLSWLPDCVHVCGYVYFITRTYTFVNKLRGSLVSLVTCSLCHQSLSAPHPCCAHLDFTLLKMGRYYNTTMLHYWEMLVK